MLKNILTSLLIILEKCLLQKNLYILHKKKINVLIIIQLFLFLPTYVKPYLLLKRHVCLSTFYEDNDFLVDCIVNLSLDNDK